MGGELTSQIMDATIWPQKRLDGSSSCRLSCFSLPSSLYGCECQASCNPGLGCLGHTHTAREKTAMVGGVLTTNSCLEQQTSSTPPPRIFVAMRGLLVHNRQKSTEKNTSAISRLSFGIMVGARCLASPGSAGALKLTHQRSRLHGRVDHYTTPAVPSNLPFFQLR